MLPEVCPGGARRAGDMGAGGGEVPPTPATHAIFICFYSVENYPVILVIEKLPGNFYEITQTIL